MLTEQLNKAWKARRSSTAVDAVMRFAEEGLVLGVGTVLAKSTGDARHISVDPAEPRLRALLAAAHSRSPTAESLSHLRKAAQRWSEGEAAMAAMHLALSGLNQLERPEVDAHRLFLADGLLNAGFTANAIIDAIDTGDADLNRVQKYNPDQPRVPAGSGRTSGEWTSTDDGLSDAPQQPEVNPSTVTPVVLPPQGMLDACEEATSDCIKAAINASGNDAANDNSRFVDVKNCMEAGVVCEAMSWGIEDEPLPLGGGVRFPHGGVVLIDKFQLDRYLPPLFGGPPPIRRSADQAPRHREPLSKLARNEIRTAEDYSCPPWTPVPDETISASQTGFGARLKPIYRLSSRLNGRVAEPTCSLSKQWGKVVRAKVTYEHQGSLASALVTCWSHPGSELNIDAQLECCCEPADKFPARTAARPG